MLDDVFISLLYLVYLEIMKYKLFNSNNMSDDWISLKVQQNFNGRNKQIQIFKKLNYKVGGNLLANRFHS